MLLDSLTQSCKPQVPNLNQQMISIFSWIAPPLSLSFSFSNPPSSLLSILVRAHRLLHLVECILSLFTPPPLSLSGIISSISVLPPWWRCVVTWHERLSFIGRWPHVVVEANDPSKSGRLWNNYFAFVFLFFFFSILYFCLNWEFSAITLQLPPLAAAKSIMIVIDMQM